jgi:stearoyl-CoA 9-desaturase NADPH oxidoreductase
VLAECGDSGATLALSVRNRFSADDVVEGEEPMRSFTYGASSMRGTLPISARRFAGAAAMLTTPLLPDDYLGYLNPLWSCREPRGVVVGVLPETAEAATIWLRTPARWPAHTPGQYVRVGVDVDGIRHWRTYSLTSLPNRRDGRIAITVKAIANGVVSNQLVRRTRPGDLVRLAPPTGEFTLPGRLPQRILFVTAGSGITPVAGMLRDLAERRALRNVVHVHLAPSRDDAIFGDELRRLAHRQGSLRYGLHEHCDDTHGTFTVHRLNEVVLDLPKRDTWACGPAGLLDALSEHWKSALNRPDQLNIERFRPVVATSTGQGGTVRFTVSDREVDADGATPILVAGEEAGALLPSGCRMGICNTCVGRLTSGAVRDLRTGDIERAEGQMVRTCCSAAAGAVEIEL